MESLAKVCAERNVAVQTIKSIALAPWWGADHTSDTWYRPLTDQADIDRAVHWVLGRSGLFLNTVGDVELLPKVLDAASRFGSQTSEADMAELASERAMLTLFP